MTRVTRTVRRAGWALLLGAAVATCRDAPLGPGRGGRASLALAPELPALASNLAAFGIAIDSLRVVVVRPAADTVADTTVAFAADQDSLQLAISLPLEASPETFDISMQLRGGGFVLFSAATSADVNAGSNPPIPITNFTYVGPGAGITSLVVSPADSVIEFGDSLRFRVDALAGTTPVTQFYVSWSTSANNTTINAHGVMTAPAQRGTVFVTATTPNGVTATVPVTFVPLPTSVTAVPPLPNNVPASSVIGPLRVRVLAADGLGVKGVPVTFAAVSGGGLVSSPLVATDSAGYAETAATSGPGGTSVYSATVTGLAPVTFNVAVLGQTASQLAYTVPPTGAIVNQPFGVIVEVRDSTGAVVASATDPVTIALGANPGGATLGGTLTVNAVSGIAVFGDLTLNQPDSGYTLVATAPGLTQAISPPFSVFPGLTGQMWINPAGGTWNNPANWSGGFVPAVDDTVYITLDGDYVVTLDSDVDVSMLIIGGASGTQTITGTARALTVDTLLSLSPTAVVNLVGGSLGGTNASVLNQGAIRLQNAPLSAVSIVNYAGASLLARGAVAVTGTLINSTGATVRVEGDASCCNTTLSIGDLSNAGLVELTSISGSSVNVMLAVLGELANAPGATVAILPGTGGTRTIQGQVNNLGFVQVDHDLVLGGSAAAHNNSGTIQLSGGNVTVNQSVSDLFYNDGTVVIGAGRTFAVNGGTLDYDSPAPGGIAGLGTLSLNGATFAMDTDLGNDTLNLSFINTQVQGSATLTSAAGRTLTVQTSTIAVPFDNQGTFVVRGATGLSGTVTTSGGSIMRLLGDPTCCNTTLSVASGFSNNGTIELTSVNGSTVNVSLVVNSGTLNNGAGATLAVLPGTGGGRSVQAQLANDGSVLIAHDASLDAPDVDYLNTGQIHLTTGNLTLNQSGGSPTFAANGPIVVDAGRTFTVNGGSFQDSNVGNLGGLGTVAFNGATVSVVATELTHDTLSLSFVNSTVNGPGTLQTALGRTMTIQSTAVNAPFVNFGQLIALGTSSLGGTVTTNTGSAIQVLADPGVANAQLTVANGFTNNGLLELTQVNGSTANATLIVPSGALNNAPGATIAVRAGTGGTRDLQAWINNQGQLLVEHDVTLNAPSSDHTNSGQILLTGGSLTVVQGGTTPTFGTTGEIVVGAGRVLNVQAGVFNYQPGEPGGLAGTGTVNFAGGVVNLGQDLGNDTLTIGFTNSTVTGAGTLRTAPGRTMLIQQTSIGTAFVNQGTLVARGTSSLNAAVSAMATGTIQVLGDVAVAAGSLTVANPLNNEGAIVLSSVGGAVGAAFAATGGVINNPGATISIEAGTGGARTFTGQLTNHGTFSTAIASTLDGLDVSHVNFGTLEVTAGTLTIAQSGPGATFTNQGLIFVPAGATLVTTGGTLINAPTGTLSGGGTIDALGTAFTNDGTVAPGASPGQLTFNGNLPLSTQAVLSIEIGGLTPGSQYDQIVVTGGGTLAGTLNVTLISGFTPAISNVFTIVSGAGVAGVMGSLNLPSVPGAIWLPAVNAAGLQLTLVSASALIPKSWDGGGGDGLWGTAANWNPDGVPGTGDSVIINPGTPVTVTVNTTATAAFLDIGTVVGNGAKTLAIAGQTLTLTAGGVVGTDGIVNLSAGTLTGGGTLQVDGAFNWSGGTLSGAGLVQVGPAGTMSFSGTGTKNLNSRQIQATGTVTWVDGTIGSGGGAELRVQPGGTFAVNGNAQWLHSLGGSPPKITVEPAATLLRSVGTGAATFNVPLDNAGVTQVQSGTLDLRGGTSSGTFDVAATAQLDFAGGTFSVSDGTQFTGTGIVRVAGGTLDVAASTVFNPRVHLVSGILQGVDNITIQDSLVWTGGTLSGTGNVSIVTGANLVIDGNVTFSGRTIINSGAVTWISGQINSGSGAQLQNQSVGVVDLRTDGTWAYNLGGAPPRLTNTGGGVLQRTTGTGLLDIRAAVDNGGSLAVQSGILALNGGGNSTGSFNVVPGAELSFSGAHTLSGTSGVTAGGVVSFPGGTTTLSGTYDVTGQTVINGGTVAFSGADTARTNQLAVQSGTLGGTSVVLVRVSGAATGGILGGTGQLRVPAGVTFDVNGAVAISGRAIANAGQVTWTSGQISSGNGAVFNNETGAVLDIRAAGATWFHNLGGAQPVVNNLGGGQVRRSTVAGTTTLNVPFNNAGNVDLQIGTLVLATGGTASGTHTVAAGGTLQPGATHSWATGARFAGAGRVLIPSGATVNIDAIVSDTVQARWIELAGGIISGLGVLRTVDSLVWTSGSLQGAGVVRIPVGGLMTIRGATGKSFSTRTIANAGVVWWTGTGGISSGNGAALINENGASFQLESDADWLYNQGGAIPHIDNLTGGLIKRATAVSAINVGAALNNDGTLDLQTGTVTFTNGGASKGLFTLLAPGVLGFGGGNHTLDVGSNVTGSGSVQVSGGSMTVTGDYILTGTTRVSGGVASFDGSKPAELTSLDLSGGTIAGSGQVFLHGVGNWSSGGLAGTGVLRVMSGASLTLEGGNGKTFVERTILDQGTIVWKDGPISSGRGAVLNIDAAASFDANAKSSWSYNLGGAQTTIQIARDAFMNFTTDATNIGSGVVINNQGTLDISPNATLKMGGELNLLTGSTLRGSGTLDVQGASKVVNQGTTRPGTSPGVLRIIGDWAPAAGATLVIEIFGPEVGTGHDQLVVTGRLTPGGALHLVGNGTYQPRGLSIPVARYGSYDDKQSFSVSLLGGLNGLQGINYLLTELRMLF